MNYSVLVLIVITVSFIVVLFKKSIKKHDDENEIYPKN
jgi:hypothetical protein